MTEMEITPNPIIILDKKANILCPGEYSGGLILKFQNHLMPIIFSDYLLLTQTSLEISGLLVGIKNGHAFSNDQRLHLDNLDKIDFIARLDPEIVKEFDNARFSAIYPNIIRFLHTSLLYHDTSRYKVNHLELVAGEILHRPIAILKNRGVIIGDRLVGDRDLQLVFYDCIIIGEETEEDLYEDDSENCGDKSSSLGVSYEHFMMFPLDQIESIFLLGTENF